VAVAALVLSLVALGGLTYHWFLRSDPLGKGLSSYDLSTPTAAAKSMQQIDANMDLKAVIELQRKTKDKKLKEKIDTFEVKKETTWKDKTLLFITYKEEGKAKYDVVGMEKKGDPGVWTRSYVSDYEVENDNKDLAATMRSWKREGSLTPKPEDNGPGGFPDFK
jgi:hypothetical protein